MVVGANRGCKSWMEVVGVGEGRGGFRMIANE